MILQVPEDLDGLRVDKVLAVLLGVSRAEARSLVEGGVKLDGVPATGSERVRAGSLLDTPKPLVAGGLEPEDVRFGVVHEDPDLIVVDKPAGVVVHPGAGHAKGTLAAGLLFRYPELEGVGAADRWGLVHRLDRDTSGLLLIGRNQRAFETLAGALARREITRSYLALVRGAMDIETGTIEAPIGRDPTHPTRRAVLPGGKSAVTHYRLIRDYTDEDLALLDVNLDTGRTHQIRVHMAAIEHPVLGDPIYGRPGPGVVAPRVFLHAHRLVLRHPDTGQRVEFESPLPDDLRQVLDRLGGPVPQ
ncbi:MAG: RluA family pseudouridine synthase [Acidimicrobiia bacterium]